MAAARPFSYTTMFETVRGVGNLLAPEDFSYFTELPPDAPESPLVIHLSCMAHYTPHIPQLAQRILERIGLECVIVGGPENCCGELHKHLGDSDLERQTAKIAMSSFRSAKPRHVVSICPDCDEQFRKHGAERQRFRHSAISHLFRENLERLRAEMQPVDMRIVTHVHTVNEARQADATNMLEILAAVPGLTILPAEHALGPGVHCQTLHPMPVEDQARMFTEASSLGADALVVPYHSCYRQHVKMQLSSGVPVHHYLNILAMAFRIPFSEPFKEMRLLDSVDAVLAALRPRIEGLGYSEEVVRRQIQRAIFC